MTTLDRSLERPLQRTRQRGANRREGKGPDLTGPDRTGPENPSCARLHHYVAVGNAREFRDGMMTLRETEAAA